MTFNAGDSGVLPVFDLRFGFGSFAEKRETLQIQTSVEDCDLVPPGEIESVIKSRITSADDDDFFPGNIEEGVNLLKDGIVNLIWDIEVLKAPGLRTGGNHHYPGIIHVFGRFCQE